MISLKIWVTLSLTSMMFIWNASAQTEPPRFVSPYRRLPDKLEKEAAEAAFDLVYKYHGLIGDKEKLYKDMDLALRRLATQTGLDVLKKYNPQLQAETKVLSSLVDKPFSCQDEDYAELLRVKEHHAEKEHIYVFLDDLQEKVEKNCVTQLMVKIGYEEPHRKERIISGIEPLRQYIKQKKILPPMTDLQVRKFMKCGFGRAEAKEACFEAHQLKLQTVKDHYNFRRTVGNVFYQLRHLYCSDEQSECGKVLKEWDPIWLVCDPLYGYNEKPPTKFEKLFLNCFS